MRESIRILSRLSFFLFLLVYCLTCLAAAGMLVWHFTPASWQMAINAWLAAPFSEGDLAMMCVLLAILLFFSKK